MKKFCFAFLTFFYLSYAQAQDTTIVHQENIMRDANKLADAMEEQDWSEVLKLTYKPIIELAGGEANMIRQARLSDQSLKQQGFEIKKVELSDPLQELESDGVLMSIIPIRLTFDGPLGNLYSESSLLGISVNKGTDWRFISMTQVDMNQLLKLFPNLNNKLVFPRKRVYQN